MHDRKLYGLTFVAAFMTLGHHVDHVIRGNNVGWPVSEEVNAFTYSLVIYPLILAGLREPSSRRVRSSISTNQEFLAGLRLPGWSASSRCSPQPAFMKLPCGYGTAGAEKLSYSANQAGCSG